MSECVCANEEKTKVEKKDNDKGKQNKRKNKTNQQLKKNTH